MKIVFFGSSKYVIPILEVLRKNYDLVLVLTTEKLPTEPVSHFAKHHKIPYQSVKLFDQNLKSLILNLESPLGVLAYFGLILPKEVLELFPKGILNIHPSLLPKYRGATPGQTAILNGEMKTGVSLIKLDEEVDHGPVLAMKEEPILPSDTSETLYERLFAIGSKLLEQNFEPYLNNKSVQKVQDHSLATFTHHLTRRDGFIDSESPPSPEKLERMIRAYHPWPGVWFKLKFERGALREGKLKIIKLLPEKRVQVEGGKPMSYKDFLNGYPETKQVLARLGLWGEK